MLLNWNYIKNINFIFLQLIFYVKVTQSFVYTIEKNIDVTMYDKESGETFVAIGNVIVRLSGNFTEIGRYEVGDQFGEDPECAEILHGLETCENITNTITIMELLSVYPETMLFVCLNLGENKCYILEVGKNKAKRIGIINEQSFFESFSESKPSSSIGFEPLNHSNNHTKYFIFTYDISMKRKNSNFFFVFSLIKVTDIQTDLPKVQMLSKFKLHVGHNFTVLTAFQKDKAFYFVVRYLDPKDDVSISIIQIKVINESAQLLETRIKCEDSFYVNQASFLAEENIQILYILNRKIDNRNIRTVCEIDTSSLETHFDNINADCIDQKKGSYPNWLNLDNSNRSCSPCEKMKDETTIVLSPSILFLRQSTRPFSLNGEFVAMESLIENNETVLYLLRHDHFLQKVKLYPVFAKLSGVDLFSLQPQEVLPKSAMWIGKGTVVTKAYNKIISMKTGNCSMNKEIGTCVRDTFDCVWCRGMDRTSYHQHCVARSLCSDDVMQSEVDQKNISVSYIQPMFSVREGSIFVEIHGTNLDLATNMSVFLKNRHCTSLRVISQTFMVCKMSSNYYASDRDYRNVTFHVLLDGKSFYLPFTYRETLRLGPVFSNETIQSGGIKISINAEDLTMTDSYYLTTMEQSTSVGTQVSVKCNVSSTNSLSCVTPPVSKSNGHLASFALTLRPLDAQIHLKSSSIVITMFVVEDPVIYSMEIMKTTSTLTIKGKGFKSVDKSEILVTSDRNGPLEINTLTNTRMMCYISNKIDSHHISIRFGRNLVYYPGFAFFTSEDNDTTSPIYETEYVSFETTHTSLDETLVTKFRGATMNPESSKNLALIISLSSIAVFLVIASFACRRKIFKFFKHTQHRLDRDRPSIVSYRAQRVMIGDLGGHQSLSMSDTYNDDTLLTDCMDESTTTLVQRFEEEKLLIKRDCLELIRLIGQGNFGSVFKGYLLTSDDKLCVAVKTLHKNEHRDMNQLQFLKEAYVMKNFSHENVMQLIGICLETEETPLVILPFMEHGDLLSYLHEDKHIPTVKDLVSFGLDISRGMEYLSGLKFVHRDLAARNCMLDATFKVKVADFGLSRDVYETSYYSTQSKGTKLPVKWMAVESLAGGVFNEKTDVWSYGITLWELMTRGVRPYAAVDNWDMERYLKSGRRLPQPLYCPAQLYKLMRRCWSINPDDRPTFTFIRQCISDMLEKVHHQLGDTQKNSNISTVYVNLNMCSGCTYENQEMF